MPEKTDVTIIEKPLLGDIRQLIDAARQRAAVAVNAEISLLYWQVGQRIHQSILQGERAEYGKQVIANLSKQLMQMYGKGWSTQQLRHCVNAAEAFPDKKIFYTLCRELSWSHLRVLIYMGDPLKREQIELLELDQSSIHVAEYLTTLPSKEVLAAKLHESIQHARQRMVDDG